MTNAEYKNIVIDEYNKAKVQFDAMAALAKAKGIDVDGGSDPTPQPTPTPIPTPTPEPTPEPTPVPTGNPTIVYTGPLEYTISRGEQITINILFNYVESTKDFVISPNFTVAMATYDIKAYPTTTGYKEVIILKGNGSGSGSLKVYLKADRTQDLIIKVNVR